MIFTAASDALADEEAVFDGIHNVCRHLGIADVPDIGISALAQLIIQLAAGDIADGLDDGFNRNRMLIAFLIRVNQTSVTICFGCSAGRKSYEKLSTPADPEYFIDYFYSWHAISTGMIIRKWVCRGCKESAEELTAVTIRLYQTMNYQWN